MMHPDEIERMKTGESENPTRIHGTEPVDCTMHEDRNHQHPLCPPMGQKGVLIQSWYCCQCGIVGQSVLIDRRLLRALPKFAGEHGPMLNIEYIDASSIGKSKKGR